MRVLVGGPPPLHRRGGAPQPVRCVGALADFLGNGLVEEGAHRVEERLQYAVEVLLLVRGAEAVVPEVPEALRVIGDVRAHGDAVLGVGAEVRPRFPLCVALHVAQHDPLRRPPRRRLAVVEQLVVRQLDLARLHDDRYLGTRREGADGGGELVGSITLLDFFVADADDALAHL